MEKDRCASKVRMKVSRKCFLVSIWPNNVRAFSVLAGTWRGGHRGDDGEDCEERRRGMVDRRKVGNGWTWGKEKKNEGRE